MESFEDILKLVFSLVFAAIYFFGGQMFKGNKDDDSQRPKNLRKTGEDNQEPDEHELRQREIREAIRRKIMERRSKNTDSGPVFEKPVAQEVQNQQQSRDDSRSFEATEASSSEITEPIQETSKADEDFSWDVSDNVYEKQMQERLLQIEATRRRAEALKQKVGKINLASEEDIDSKKSISEELLSGPVRSVFRNPRAARAAFIYGEILGKPLSLRQSGSNLAN